MDLTLTIDQLNLQSALREASAKIWTPERLREAADSPAFDVGSWAALAEMGVFGITSAEFDGMRLGLADAAILFEELGRALVPGPLVATLLAARFVPDVVDGGVRVTALDTRDPVAVAEYCSAADYLIIVDDSGLFISPTAGLDTEEIARPLDPLTPASVVNLPPELGERIGSPVDSARWRTEGAVLTAALQVGVAQGALDLAVRYAGERVQFGRLIGSFQAVKHLLAESLVRTDIARAAVLVAALEVAERDEGDAPVAVSAAKALADQAASEGGRTCIQVHGGMGFTWEVLAHLYVKRAWVLATGYGSADKHFQQLAAAL